MPYSTNEPWLDTRQTLQLFDWGVSLRRNGIRSVMYSQTFSPLLFSCLTALLDPNSARILRSISHYVCKSLRNHPQGGGSPTKTFLKYPGRVAWQPLSRVTSKAGSLAKNLVCYAASS